MPKEQALAIGWPVSICAICAICGLRLGECAAGFQGSGALQRFMVGLDERSFFHYCPCMSKMAKNPGSAPEEFRFEEALKQLETIVEAMESGDLPLETMLSRFEEGVKLSRHCQAKLDEAEVKIQQLEKTADGELTLKPLDEINPAA